MQPLNQEVSLETPTSKFTIEKVPYEKVPSLSQRDLSYIQLEKELEPFYKYQPDLTSFKKVIDDKSNNPTDRKLLVKVLKEQYKKLDPEHSTLGLIESLEQENTFTVVTAHQPSLFTGPLYYFYKIASTIHLARQLNEAYPTYNFIPVFVSGGEDHDFEEVNHLHLFNKTITWESGETGAVGNMKTASLKPVLEELKEILGSSNFADEAYELLSQAHFNHSIYADAVFQMVHKLFGKYGLIFFNMNQADLKRAFIPIMKDELFNQPSSAIIEKTIEELDKRGYSAQASPREINLFYLRDQHRDRIVFEEGKYRVLNSEIQFSKEELENELDNHPERFSPNVVMRPLYQETILPNLAYIGGGGEIAYWLERKQQFEHYGLNFPMLIRRNSVLWIDKGSLKKMEKLNLSIQDLMEDTDAIIKAYVKESSENELTITDEIETIEKAFVAIAAKAKEVDPGLEKAILAEKTRQLKTVDQLGSRLLRTEKQKHDTAINQIRSLKDKLFPGNGLQERYDNFLSIYLKNGPDFIDFLIENLNPLEREFLVITE
ncbi:MAG: bacillithiol biosynthesis cysteine-adding enzyme BshC [Saprospiraceae bacterium]